MSAGASRLALGTVQFGLAYGAFNQRGQVAPGEAQSILSRAAAAGIDLLDTAHAYGSSEEVLGSLAAGRRFRIVTKIPCLGGRSPDEIPQILSESLRRLRAKRVHGLMLHSASDLLGEDGRSVWAALERARSAGLADRIGLSVYSPAEAGQALDRYPVEIIQLPFSVFDQRFPFSGMLDRLKKDGVEVHARSIFLQGFMLADPDRLNGHLARFRQELRALQSAAAKAGLSPLALALRFALSEPRIDRFVIGVQSADELEEILAACEADRQLPDLSGLASGQVDLIEPSRWRQERNPA